MRDETRSALSAPRRGLLRLFQRVRYGRFFRLEVREGEPVLTPDLGWARTLKVPGDNGPHPASSRGDFALRKEVVAFFGLLDEIGDGTVHDLVVRDGLPAEFQLHETLAD